MQLDDETKQLLYFLRGSDILWLADKLGRGDEFLDRLRANKAEEDARGGGPMPASTDEPSGPLAGDEPSIVDDGNDANGRELVQREPRASRAAGTEPQRTELTFGEPRMVMLGGPRWAERANYEAFIEAGGEVNTRGFDLELRGESLDEKRERIEREEHAAKLEARKAAREARAAELAAEEQSTEPPRLSDHVASEARD